MEGSPTTRLQTSLQATGESISWLLQHILNAEAYRLEKVHEPRLEFWKRPDLAGSRSALKELELGTWIGCGAGAGRSSRHPARPGLACGSASTGSTPPRRSPC